MAAPNLVSCGSGQDCSTFTLIPTMAGFAVVGDLDVSNWTEVARMLDRLVHRPGDIELDLSAVSFADVGTAALFMATARRLGPGRVLVLRRPPAPLMSMLELLCPDGVPAVRVIAGCDWRAVNRQRGH
jgi:ABC-type transporter Mla MlaB component